MSTHIYGAAPGAVADPVHGTTAFFYRYELVGDSLVRRSVGEKRIHLAQEVRLVDVLVNEDDTGRYLNVVRGIALSERDLARVGSAAGIPAWREFEVGRDVLLAIGRDLGLGIRGRRPPRLVAVDGKRLD